jgi:hypothetical protein
MANLLIIVKATKQLSVPQKAAERYIPRPDDKPALRATEKKIHFRMERPRTPNRRYRVRSADVSRRAQALEFTLIDAEITEHYLIHYPCGPQPAPDPTFIHRKVKFVREYDAAFSSKVTVPDDVEDVDHS